MSCSNTPCKHRGQSGFTLVEVVISITVAVIMTGVLFLATFRFFANAVQSQQTAELALESQTLLGQMIEDLRLSAGINATNQIVDANQPVGSWATSDPNNVLIITTPATTTSNDIIYDPNTGFPYQNEIIYFISNKTMYKRVLKNTSASGNKAITNCPEASSSPTCPSDRVFTTNVDNITFTMYDDTNTVTTNTAQAASIAVTVYLSKKVFSKTVSLSNSMRVTQRNL